MSKQVIGLGRWRAAMLSGLAATLILSFLIGLVQLGPPPLIMTSWASSLALILSAPHGASAAPHRVLLCHILSALIGVLLAQWLSHSPWAIAPAVGLALAFAMSTDLVHPPAIANAAIIFTTASSGPHFLGAVLLGACVLSITALLRRHVGPQTPL